ncbi:transmembrane protein 233 [Callorhinchus milii]|uniref:transmembrane protein 233 n=1 Tax=Callorhinchus milii TaxID=7868 RepID=UPI0004574EDB|nr:transmembrane protein 233 [Callorhinchus milii]XP_042193577.1 transmembrane protein 233 [Callorhinchus milii]XP_042193578.1 transmembrane protein 233 [Callorhinchus milii]|eukprot:gi/632983307/ref/XP_007908582.1/ PREDICTED: transmembrane protein 233 [Callorhinchus milii]
MSHSVNHWELKRSLEESPETHIDNESQRERLSPNSIILSVLSCFCPSYPINIVAFVFSMMSLQSYNRGDIDESKKLGRVAKLVAIAAIILGLLVIGIFCIVHFTTNQ